LALLIIFSISMNPADFLTAVCTSETFFLNTYAKPYFVLVLRSEILQDNCLFCLSIIDIYR